MTTHGGPEGGWAQRSWEGTSGDVSADTPGRPLLSGDGEMASGLAGLACHQTARPPHLSTVPEGGAGAACGLWGVTFAGSSAGGRGGTGCVRHLRLLTRPPRGRQPLGWEAKQRLVPTASPDKATEESGQQVVERAAAQACPNCICRTRVSDLLALASVLGQ